MTGSGPDAQLAAAEAQAHRLYFEQHSMAALARWRVCAALGPPTLETQLALAHCEIEAGADPDLPPLGVPHPDAPSNGRARDYAERILASAWAHFNAGDVARADKLARLVAAVDPHLASVYRRQILPLSETAEGGAAGLPAPSDPAAPLPFERTLRLDDAAARALVARHQARRVLLFMPWWRLEASGPVEGILTRQLRTSLEELGIAVTVIETYRLEHLEHLALHERLRGVIAEFRPDVIVCADMMVSGATSYAPLQDGILAVLADARRAGVKLVFSYSDSWYVGMPALFGALAEHTDIFHIPFPGLLRQVAPALAGRVFCHPFPVDDPRPAAARDVVPAVRGAFVGGISWANLSRLAWCIEIKRAGLPIDIHLTTQGGFQTPAGYAALLARYAVSINMVTRITGEQIATGRAIEAPFMGSLLLEEASEDTAYFLRPYEHYVPFDTFAELTERLALLLADAPLRARITASGTAWVRSQFGALHFWARTFHALYETERAAAPPAPQHFREITVRFPHSAQTYFELARPLR